MMVVEIVGAVASVITIFTAGVAVGEAFCQTKQKRPPLVHDDRFSLNN